MMWKRLLWIIFGMLLLAAVYLYSKHALGERVYSVGFREEYDEEGNAIHTVFFPDKHTSSLLLKDGLTIGGNVMRHYAEVGSASGKNIGSILILYDRNNKRGHLSYYAHSPFLLYFTCGDMKHIIDVQVGEHVRYSIDNMIFSEWEK